METISVSEARRRFSETLNHVREDNARYIVEKSGIPVAAVVSVEDAMRLEQMDEARAQQLSDLRAAIAFTRADFQDTPPEEIEAEIEKAVSDIKTSHRSERRRATAPSR